MTVKPEDLFAVEQRLLKLRRKQSLTEQQIRATELERQRLAGERNQAIIAELNHGSTLTEAAEYWQLSVSTIARIRNRHGE